MRHTDVGNHAWRAAPWPVVLALWGLLTAASAQAPVTLTLGPMPLGHVFADGTLVRIPINSNGDAVLWQVKDFAGQTVGQGRISPANGAGAVTLPVGERGYFTLHLSASKEAGPAKELTTTFAVLAPFDLAHVADSPFGVMTHFAQGWDTDLIPLIVQAGAKEARDEAYWDQVEAAPGVFAFPLRVDTYMTRLEQSHLSSLMPLTFENHNYDGGQTPYTDAGFDAYARYGGQVLTHFGSQIRAVEVWNEYNGSFCKGPAAQDRAATYAKMLARAYHEIKRTRPGVTVLGGGTAGVPMPYFEKLFQAGALTNMDAVSVHPYRYGEMPEGIEQDITKLDALIRRYNGGRPKPIWVTEVGWFLKKSAAPGDLAIDESDQAKFVVRAYTLLLSAGVRKVFWYLFRDYGAFATMGLVRSDRDPLGRYAPKPAFVSFATMTRQLTGRTFVRREPTLASLYSLVFRRPAGTDDVRVLWSLTPRALTVRTAGPVRVVDVMGQERTLAPVGGRVTVTLSDAPLYLHGGRPVLPPPDRAATGVIANSVRDFSDVQGTHGWFYGYGAAPDFTLLPQHRLTDWREEWVGPGRWLSLTAGSQHPDAIEGRPVRAVRRWVSMVAGRVRIVGDVSRGTEGDGTGVQVVNDGQTLFSRLLGGGQPVRAHLDVTTVVKVGSHIDFAVDPGPGTNIDYDETQIAVTISRVTP